MEARVYDMLESLEWNQLFNFGLHIEKLAPAKKGTPESEEGAVYAWAALQGIACCSGVTPLSA